MVYPRIYHVYPSDWIYMVYPWIYHVYPPSINMVYPRIYMVYHWMYIHGIYMVYCGISMDIPSFLKPDFAAGQCCCSHSMRTRVWVITSILFHAPTWQLRQGKRLDPTAGSTQKAQPYRHKRLNPTAANVPRLSLVALVTAAAAAVLLAAFHFPSLLAGNNLNLGEGWGRGCLQDR